MDGDGPSGKRKRRGKGGGSRWGGGSGSSSEGSGSEDEGDEEDPAQAAARQAAMLTVMRKSLTEVLLEVTEALFGGCWGDGVRSAEPCGCHVDGAAWGVLAVLGMLALGLDRAGQGRGKEGSHVGSGAGDFLHGGDAA